MQAGSPLITLAELLVKSAAVVFVAQLILKFALRRASASRRHIVFVGLFAALALLPLTLLVPTRWMSRWTWSPGWLAFDREGAKEVKVVSAAWPAPSIGGSPEKEGGALPEASSAGWFPTGLTASWTTLVLVGWSFGASILLGRRIAAAIRLRALLKRSCAIPAAREAVLHAMLDALPGAMRVRIRESGEVAMPMVIGVAGPVVMLPLAARRWSGELLESVLRHEVAHVVRRDCATRLVAELICAIYWPNPLVWIAARQMRLVQEQACDDFVLMSGADARRYASHLVEVVRAMGECAPCRGPLFAIAMAQPSSLESRVAAVVDPQIDRGTSGATARVAAACAVVAGVALSSIAQLRSAEPSERRDGGRAGDQPAKIAGAGEAGPQIVLEAKFIQLSEEALGTMRELLPLRDILASSTDSGPAIRKMTAQQHAALLRAVSDMRGIDLLSAPRLTSRSGNEARIEMVREVRYPIEWKPNPTTGKPEPVEYSSRNVGITLGAIATPSASGEVELTLRPELVELEGFVDYTSAPGTGTSSGQPDLKDRVIYPELDQAPPGHIVQPIFHSRKVDTSLALWPGRSVLLHFAKGQPVTGIKQPRQMLVLVRVDVAKEEGKTLEPDR